MYTSEEKAIFAKAKNLGIHRTVHAGEDGPASNVVIVRTHLVTIEEISNFLD